MRWLRPGLLPIHGRQTAYGACSNGTVNVEGRCQTGLTNTGTEKCQAGGQAGKKCQSGAAAGHNCNAGTTPHAF